MNKEEFEQLKSTVKQWLFHTGSLDPTNYANELKLRFIEPREKRITELGKENAELKASKDEAIKKLIADMAGLEEELSEKDRQIGELENDMTTAISLLEKAECTSCIYTDSPCVRGDYPMKDGHCTHHKHFSDEIAILKAQIEKMKCCENCKHHYFIGDELECHLLDNGISCDDKEKWEIKEK